MNIFEETFDRSSISRKQVVKESYNRELNESSLSARIESIKANPAKYVVEYDFQNISKSGEPLITEHLSKVLYANSVEEAENLFDKMVEQSRQYDKAFVAISRPIFLGDSLLDTATYRVYTDGKIIKDVALESCKSAITESSSCKGEVRMQVFKETFEKFRKMQECKDNTSVDNISKKTKVTESCKSPEELDWTERSATRRVAAWTDGIYDIELEEHNSFVDGFHYYVYIDNTELEDAICNGREFGSVAAALSYINAITSSSPLTEAEETDNYEAESVKFAELLEDRIKKAFPGCEYEEVLATQGKHGIDYIYVTLFGHPYEVHFDAAAQEDDIREQGADKAAQLYADDAISNIQQQIIVVANQPDDLPDFNEGNAAAFLDELENKIKASVKKFMMRPEIGFPENEVEDYSRVSVDLVGEHIEIYVAAELSYEPLENLCTELNKVITEYDKNAYFEPECPGRIVAYLMQYPYIDN